MKMDEEDHKPRQALRKNNKKSEKALSQADFPKNPVISFSVLRARLKFRQSFCSNFFIRHIVTPAIIAGVTI